MARVELERGTSQPERQVPSNLKGGTPMIISRRQLLLTSAAAGTAVMLGSRAFAATPPLAKKDTYKVGFAQTESNNPWRLAQTASMQDEAARSSATSSSTPMPPDRPPSRPPTSTVMIAQGVDLIFLPPREEKPLIPAIMQRQEGRHPGHPVDRDVDHRWPSPARTT